MKQTTIRAIALATAAWLLLPNAAALAGDPDFLTFGAGWFDWNRQKKQAGEINLEYRSDRKLWVFKPLAGAMVTSTGSFYGYAGVGIDVFFGRRFVVTPSFAPGVYVRGGGHDLGHVIEFRSQAEFAYRFDDRSRLGLAVSHISNASIGDTNPGTELFTLYYSVPIPKLFGN